MILQEGKKKNSYIIEGLFLPLQTEKRLEALGMTKGTPGGSFKPEAKWNDDCACARNAFCIRQGDNWEN